MRVIDQNGEQLGVLEIGKAKALAKEKELDLVETAPKANPPVVKIVDFGKFRYQEEKKRRKSQKKQKGGEIKEVRLSPFIAENDYKIRLERVNEFLEDNNKVRLVVKFKGRQMDSKNFGYQLFDRILLELGGKVQVDMKPKFLGRHLAMVISPVKKAKKEEVNENPKSQ